MKTFLDMEALKETSLYKDDPNEEKLLQRLREELDQISIKNFFLFKDEHDEKRKTPEALAAARFVFPRSDQFVPTDLIRMAIDNTNELLYNDPPVEYKNGGHMRAEEYRSTWQTQLIVDTIAQAKW